MGCDGGGGGGGYCHVGGENRRCSAEYGGV